MSKIKQINGIIRNHDFQDKVKKVNRRLNYNPLTPYLIGHNNINLWGI